MRVKDRILDGMRRNPNTEVSGAWLFMYVYGRQRGRWTQYSALKAHIYQLRKMGYPIRGTSRGRRSPPRYIWGD